MVGLGPIADKTNPLRSARCFVDADGADDVLGTADDDLHLSELSPLLDARNDSRVPAGMYVDRDGNPHLVDLPGKGSANTAWIPAPTSERL